MATLKSSNEGSSASALVPMFSVCMSLDKAMERVPTSSDTEGICSMILSEHADKITSRAGMNLKRRIMNIFG
jgi:hypothetical protein